MSVEILGIRHHGVGSTINILKRIEEIKPDCIIIEGPEELMQSLNQVKLKDLTPPVAILAYDTKNLQSSLFYPFASFSPEWQAIQYAQKNNIYFTTADMPLKHYFALKQKEENEDEKEPEQTVNNDIGSFVLHHNPLEEIAKLDGTYDDEQWWEEKFEEQPYIDAKSYFEAIMIMMTSLREIYINSDHIHNNQREAFMRESIRKAQKDGYQNIIFVCGAWHVPALALYKQKTKEDKAFIEKLPKVEVKSSWIPWTNKRLSWYSGYGAGIQSPGWYENIWKYGTNSAKVWLTHSAKVFRKNKIDISTAHIIEAYHLAEVLSSMREKNHIGLKELDDSIISVMCMGDNILLDYIRKELTIGNKIGKIPVNISTLPLQIDFEQKIKTYHFNKSEEKKEYSLDLRTSRGLEKSLFLYQLAILNISWAEQQSIRSKGNFKEVWSLKWTAEVELDIIDKAIWGNTINLAATNYLNHVTTNSDSMEEIIRLLDLSLLAQLFDSIEKITNRIEMLTSQSYDVHLLMSTVISLMDLVRYSDVRQTDTLSLNLLIDNLLVRVMSNLSMACYGINEDIANKLAKNISMLNERIIRTDDQELLNSWLNVLNDITTLDENSFLIQGTCYRILLDNKYYTNDFVATGFSKALSMGQNPMESALWVEGFLKGSVTILIIDSTIWNILYIWVSNIDEDQFYYLLPLLRRIFSKFSTQDRFQIGKKAKKGIDVENKIKMNYEYDTTFDIEGAKKALENTLRLLYKVEENAN